MQTKICTKCKRELPLSEFSPDVAYKGGHKTWCKDCYKKVRQEWYAKNRAVANEKKNGFLSRKGESLSKGFRKRQGFWGAGRFIT